MTHLQAIGHIDADGRAEPAVTATDPKRPRDVPRLGWCARGGAHVYGPWPLGWRSARHDPAPRSARRRPVKIRHPTFPVGDRHVRHVSVHAIVCASMVADAVETFGELNVIFNNAGEPTPSFTEVDEANFNEIVRVNAWA